MKSFSNSEIFVDRSGEESTEEPEIYVIFPDGERVRFWLTGLKDDEYIKRAIAMRQGIGFAEYRENKKCALSKIT